jgi:hypothetical protein
MSVLSAMVMGALGDLGEDRVGDFVIALADRFLGAVDDPGVGLVGDDQGEHLWVLGKRVSTEHPSVTPLQVHEVRLPQGRDEIPKIDGRLIGYRGCSYLQLRRVGIEKHIQRRDLPIANDDHIQARVVGRLAARSRPPSETPGIVESLGGALRCVNEVRVGRAEIVSKFVEGSAPDEYAGRHIQYAVFGVELLNRCSAARCVALTEDFLKVTMKQFADTVRHWVSP